MSKNFLLRKEFIEQTRISEKVLKEWETLKIIKPSGMTEDKTPFYKQELVEHTNNIKKFIDMGYHPEEIQKILKKVGPPKVTDPGDKIGNSKNHLTVGGLAYRVGISIRTVKHWEDEGIIEPDMRSEGGFRLYSETYVYLCNLIKDLQLFGYSLKEIKTVSDLFRTFLAINGNIDTYSMEDTDRKLETMCREIDRLSDKMSLLKEGIQRWEDLIGKKQKEITNLKKKNQKRDKETHEKEKTGEKNE